MSRRSRPAARAKTRVKTARGRPISSTRWLQRQLNDPYVAAARKHGYRSRAAFKLIEIDDKFSLLAPGMRVVDLGAAPGGWSQVVVERLARHRSWQEGSQQEGHSTTPSVIAADLQVMEPLAGATILTGDITAADMLVQLRRLLEQSAQQQDSCGGGADLVLSDMSPSTTGHAATDHLRIIALAESAYLCARQLLLPGGSFVTKVFQGGSPDHLLRSLKACFLSVGHFKPPASRKQSPETYVIARGFRGDDAREYSAE